VPCLYPDVSDVDLGEFGAKEEGEMVPALDEKGVARPARDDDMGGT